MDEKRLKAFEDMLAAICRQYGDTAEKMAVKSLSLFDFLITVSIAEILYRFNSHYIL